MIMNNGKLAGILKGDEATQEDIMKLSVGGCDDE